MHHYIISSIFILILTLITTQITAQSSKCRSYNTLSLPVIYHDICVEGLCMNATTFMADFDLPLNSNNYPQDGYRNSPRIRNGYNQDFCAAITPTQGDLSFRPTGCNSDDCSDTACGFRAINGLTRGLVEPELGTDGYPIWRNNTADAGAKKSIASPTTFNKWYHDSSATIRIESELNLTRKGHTQTFQYQSERFFPIDGKGFWNLNDKQKDLDQNDRNFGFTTAIVSEFVYTGGENFTFRGDDDVWVFIDKKLAIDIGGLHPAECRAIVLDEVANGGVGNVYTCDTVDSIVNADNARPGETYTIPGITHGSKHTLSIFHAERHEEGSSFAMSTSIGFNSGDTSGIDYNLPSPTGARIYIGTYQYITFGQVNSAPEPIQLPVWTGTSSVTPITIILEFPPVARTQIACRILQLSSTDAASLRLNEIDRNTIRPPLDVTFVKNAANQATWASVTAVHDYVPTTCEANPQDQPSWTITVTTSGAGSGYLYCIAVDLPPGETYSDYTAEGRVRDRDFYRKWVATTISSQEPPSTVPPTTEAPVSTTQPPTTGAPTDDTTTQPPTTPTPTPTTATATPTHDAATTAPPTPTESPSTQPPTPTVTPAPTTTPAPTNAGTTASPTSTPTPTNAGTTAPPTPTPTSTPTTDVTTAPPTSTPTPTSAATTNPPTSTSAPTSAVTTAPPTSTSTSTPTVTDAPTSPSTPTIPTSTVSPTLAPTNLPTSTPTSNSSSTGVPVSSVISSSDTSTIAQLQIIVPVAVAGVIVLVLLVWGSIICWKRRRNGVFRTNGYHMEMV